MATPRHEVEVLAEGLAFVEGPRWHDGHLYLSDMYSHRVHRLERDGTLSTLCEVPGQPSGLAFTPAGELLIVSMTDRRILRLADGELREHADLGALAPYHLNDMVADADGRLYVGNFGSNVNEEPIRPTVLVRVEPDGRASVVTDDLVFPNGAVITPDGRTLIVAESFAFRIAAFDLAPDGSLSGRREWARFAPQAATSIPEVLASDAIIPDGMALDADGALWVAHAKGSGIPRVVEGGEVVDFVDTGDLAVYAAALGDDDRRTLYMCAGPPLGEIDPQEEHRGCLLRCRVDVPGAGRP